MKEKKTKTKKKPKQNPAIKAPIEKTFVEELGVVDLEENPIQAKHGRLFSVAGPDHPVAEFTEEYLVMHPSDKPYQQEDEGPSEDIVFRMDNRGVILNEIGEPRKIPGAKYNGQDLWIYWKLRPRSLWHYVIFFDQEDAPNFLTINGHRLTSDLVYKLRNMTHNGELTHFPDIDFEPDPDP